ncbi:MAG: efflux RND transporter periplasmic adaptor subunit [Chloroflexota bacterium]
MRQWLSGIAIIAVVGGIFITVSRFSVPASGVQASQAQEATVEPTPVDQGVDETDMRSGITATGHVVAKRQSNLSFDLPGLVVELPIQEGQRVTEGQLLARQDDTTLQLSLQQADLAVQAAQVALEKLLKPVDARDMANAVAGVKAAEGNYSGLAGAINPATINSYNLQYQKALDAAKGADLLRQGAGGQLKSDDPNYNKFIAQVGIAQTNAEIARLRLQQVQNGPSLLAATANIAYAQAALAQVKAGTRQIDVDDAQAQLATAKLLLDQAKLQLDKTRLVAPFAGTLTTVIIKLNEVSSGPAMLLTDDSQLYIEVSVAEANIGQIHLGQAVEFTVDALAGQKLTGKVQRIDQMANGNASVTTYTVRVALDKAAPALKMGMSTAATFITDSTP